MADFKQHELAYLGKYPRLERVSEAAEIRYGTLEEGGEPLTLATFGRILSFSRQQVVSDDVGARLGRTLPMPLGPPVTGVVTP